MGQALEILVLDLGDVGLRDHNQLLWLVIFVVGVEGSGGLGEGDADRLRGSGLNLTFVLGFFGKDHSNSV